MLLLVHHKNAVFILSPCISHDFYFFFFLYLCRSQYAFFLIAFAASCLSDSFFSLRIFSYFFFFLLKSSSSLLLIFSCFVMSFFFPTFCCFSPSIFFSSHLFFVAILFVRSSFRQIRLVQMKLQITLHILTAAVLVFVLRSTIFCRFPSFHSLDVVHFLSFTLVTSSCASFSALFEVSLIIVHFHLVSFVYISSSPTMRVSSISYSVPLLSELMLFSCFNENHRFFRSFLKYFFFFCCCSGHFWSCYGHYLTSSSGKKSYSNKTHVSH